MKNKLIDLNNRLFALCVLALGAAVAAAVVAPGYGLVIKEQIR